ncbi:MAG: 3-dehydroquinate synthase [candidate division WOR-3 bacterium]
MSDNIILIGFMGTGKDTIGRLLAEKLNRPFLSTDRMIELAENKTIKEIFTEKGEDYFRKRERWVLEMIRGIKNTAIATGGGMVIDPRNRLKLKNLGVVVHLFADLGILKKRIITENHRPLIRTITDIERLYRKRQGIYDFAKLSIDTTAMSPDFIVNKIVNQLNLKPIDKTAKEAKIYIKTESKDYPVIIGYDITEHLSIRNKRIVIITNPLVGALHLDKVLRHLKKDGNQVYEIIVPDGEEHKNFETVKMVCDSLLELNFQRQDIIISLGGGVITDIAGFVASIFKRGCRLVHIPTTLLGQVDAALGGKTGINTSYGKNMLGTFYQPEKVICDIKMLLSLPENEFRNGIAEVIKYSIINSKRMFYLLQKERRQILARKPSLLFEIIKDCVSIKASIVSKDEKEKKGFREILNFGHTIGHIIETATEYKKYSHGEAIAIGMVKEISIFNKNKKEINKIVDLLEGYSLPFNLPEEIKRCIKKLIAQDKKMGGEKIKIPVFEKIGRVRVKEVLCRKFF